MKGKVVLAICWITFGVGILGEESDDASRLLDALGIGGGIHSLYKRDTMDEAKMKEMKETAFKNLLAHNRNPLPVTVSLALYSIVSTLTTLFTATNEFRDMFKNPNPPQPPQVYDFIVVGAGTAGGIVANRLTESGLHKVLLLEAGGDPLPMNEIPMLFPFNLMRPETDWGYKIAPQKYSAFGIKDNAFPYPRGKSVGGTSNLNCMFYMRGAPRDFDNWAEITGDPQWSHGNVLSYFKKFENYQGMFKNDTINHAQGGNIYITKPTYENLFKEWMDGGKEKGYQSIDANGKQGQGFAPMEMTIGEGVRWETNRGYIQPALKRPNLKLIRYAHVSKINLNEKHEATGVSYMRNGQTIEVKASKEVILSAGAIGSPQVLMLSGIGDAPHLTSLGITSKVNLPAVGKGLLDHPMGMVGPFLHNESVSFLYERDLTYGSALEYLIKKTGPIASQFVVGVGMLSTRGDLNWPDVEAFQYTVGLGMTAAATFQNWYTLKDGTMDKLLEGLPPAQDGSWVGLTLGRTKSVGAVTLVSKDPKDAPSIDPNYYSDPGGLDIKSMVDAYKIIVDLYENTNAFKKYNTTFLRRAFPGCEHVYGDNDKDFECRIRTMTGTTYHPSSTCRMGKPDDPNAVLDTHLRVRGVKGLRVVDASVMPDITNANINAPTMMIAEKASDLILKEWHK